MLVPGRELQNPVINTALWAHVACESTLTLPVLIQMLPLFSIVLTLITTLKESAYETHRNPMSADPRKDIDTDEHVVQAIKNHTIHPGI